MTEKQQTTWKWIARAIGVIMGITGVLAAAKSLPVEVQHYAALATAILGVIYGKVHSWLPSAKPKIPPAVVLLLAAGLMVSASCKGPYDAAWRTLDGVQKARTLTAQQLAKAAERQRVACLRTHKPKTAEFAGCIKKHRDALRTWQTIARPAINTSIQITATALDIAERVKADPKIKWLELVKPAACALLGAAKAWGHWFADKGAALLAALTFAEGMVCHE